MKASTLLYVCFTRKIQAAKTSNVWQHSGCASSAPGRVPFSHQGPFEAQTASEAALFVEDRDVAEWLVKNGVWPSVERLREMAKRLDAASTTWFRAWLYKVIARRTFACEAPILCTPTSPAAGMPVCRSHICKTPEGTSRLRHCRTQLCRKTFCRAVHASAIHGAVFARRARPLTIAVDACLGALKKSKTARPARPVARMAAADDDVYNEARTSGIVGNAAGAVLGLTIIGIEIGTSLVLSAFL